MDSSNEIVKCRKRKKPKLRLHTGKYQRPVQGRAITEHAYAAELGSIKSARTTVESNSESKNIDESPLSLTNGVPDVYLCSIPDVGFITQALHSQSNYPDSDCSFESLKTQCKNINAKQFVLVDKEDCIHFVRMYNGADVSVELSVMVDKTLRPQVRVHSRELSLDHALFKDSPPQLESVADIENFLEILARYRTCIGNADPQWQDCVKDGVEIVSAPNPATAYRETNFSAVVNGLEYSSTIRTTKCCLLVNSTTVRCKECSRYRGTLRKMEHRAKHKSSPSDGDYVSSRKPNSALSPVEMRLKLGQLRDENQSLRSLVNKLERQLREQIEKAEVLPVRNSVEPTRIMTECPAEVEGAFPDASSPQRLLWQQQVKFNQHDDKRQMRWHPMVIKWCLHLQSKSASCYKVLRESGFLHLPSERTLFDYSHVSDCKNGFDAAVVDGLGSEMTAGGKLPQTDNILSQLDIDINALQPHLPSKDGDNFDVSSKSLKGINLKKKTKKERKMELWTKKMEVIKAARLEAKERKRREKTATVGDVKQLEDTLPSPELLTKESFSHQTLARQARNVEKPRSICNEKYRNEATLDDIDVFKAVLSHPACKSDPQAKISEHQQNKAIQEDSMDT